MIRVWFFLCGRILRYALAFTAFFGVIAAVTLILTGRTDLDSWLRLLPVSAGVIACPATALGYHLFRRLDHGEIPFYWNLGITPERTVRLLILSGAALFSLSILLRFLAARMAGW